MLPSVLHRQATVAKTGQGVQVLLMRRDPSRGIGKKVATKDANRDHVRRKGGLEKWAWSSTSWDNYTLKKTCYLFGSRGKQKRTLLKFLKLFNKAGFLARRHPSKDSRVHQYLQERATGCLGQGFVPPSLHQGRITPSWWVPDTFVKPSDPISQSRPWFCHP